MFRWPPAPFDAAQHRRSMRRVSVQRCRPPEVWDHPTRPGTRGFSCFGRSKSGSKTNQNIYEYLWRRFDHPKISKTSIKNKEYCDPFFPAAMFFSTSILNFFVHQCSAAGESPLGPWGELCPKMWPNVPWWISPWSNRNVNPGLIHPKRLFSWEATIKKKVSDEMTIGGVPP